jgi:protoheme IX farnesyltransferase
MLIISEKIRAYLKLTKPGVLFGNLLTTIAGFLYGSSAVIHWAEFIATVIGTTLVIGAACALNNYLDQDIDAKMKRTKSRPLITGAVSPMGALLFSIFLAISGMYILLQYTDVLVAWLGLTGFIVYVWLYGAFTKRKSLYGTLVGSVSGAIPIVAGYVAATHTIDIQAVLLFLILFFWQEPEFYSIAIYRRKEYKAANIPVISVVLGVKRAQKEIFIYTILFVIASLLLAVVGSAGYCYLAVMTLAGIYWILLGKKGLHTNDPDGWARHMFHTSLNILLLFCFMISIDRWLY